MVKENDEEDDKAMTIETTEVNEMVEVSLNSALGLTFLKTIKLKGRILDRQVVALVDPEATHNFIALNLVQSLGIPVKAVEPYGVRMGTSDSEEGRGICQSILLWLEEIDIVEEFSSLQLGSFDVIHGMKWLETSRTTQSNSKEQIMKFEMADKHVCLNGD